jgi:hypothetical protein
LGWLSVSLNEWVFIETQLSLACHHLKLSNAVGYGGRWLDTTGD